MYYDCGFAYTGMCTHTYTLGTVHVSIGTSCILGKGLGGLHSNAAMKHNRRLSTVHGTSLHMSIS